jgi:hypothetical protein
MGAAYFVSDCTVVNLSWDNIVVIVTSLQDGRLRFGGSVVGRRIIFLYS